MIRGTAGLRLCSPTRNTVPLKPKHRGFRRCANVRQGPAKFEEGGCMVLFRTSVLFFLFFGFFAGNSLADVNGKIFGTVTDPSGGLIPSAIVTATQVETGERKTVQTDSNGNYSLLALPPGRYHLQVQTSGFQTYIQEGVK